MTVMTLRRKLGDPPVIETVKGPATGCDERPRGCTGPRARLTALYALLFGVSTGILLLVTYWLLGRHFDRTLPGAAGQRRARQVAVQYLLAFAGVLLLAACARLGDRRAASSRR